MALQSARALLDELMGRARDLDPKEKDASKPEWTDPRVCKFFLVKFCPNQLFTNTKADMGPCHKVHDDFIKRAYDEKASRNEKMSFEDEFIRFCQQTLNDVERRIKRARQRLAASQTDKGDMSGALSGSILSEELQEKITLISDRIDQLLEQTEVLGCDGKVEEAQGIMKLVEKLKEEKSAVKRDNLPMHWIQQRAEIGAAQEKQMEVCDVCGAFLIVNDVQQRVDDHLMGKQHVGFGKLKTSLDEILERRKEERNVEMKDSERPVPAFGVPVVERPAPRDRWRDSGTSRSRSKSKEREPEKEREKEERDRKRVKERERDSRESPSRSQSKTQFQAQPHTQRERNGVTHSKYRENRDNRERGSFNHKEGNNSQRCRRSREKSPNRHRHRRGHKSRSRSRSREKSNSNSKGHSSSRGKSSATHSPEPQPKRE